MSQFDETREKGRMSNQTAFSYWNCLWIFPIMSELSIKVINIFGSSTLTIEKIKESLKLLEFKKWIIKYHKKFNLKVTGIKFLVGKIEKDALSGMHFFKYLLPVSSTIRISILDDLMKISFFIKIPLL